MMEESINNEVSEMTAAVAQWVKRSPRKPKIETIFDNAGL